MKDYFKCEFCGEDNYGSFQDTKRFCNTKCLDKSYQRKPPPSVEEICESFNYDPETGIISRKNGFSKISTHPSGYVKATFKSRYFAAHVLAWVIMKKEWPSYDIDHINRIKHDNRWENLRIATCSENRMNTTPSIVNKTGYKGVYKHKGKYRAVTYFKYKQFYLGQFDTPEEAAKAYNDKVKELYGDFAYLNKDSKGTTFKGQKLVPKR